MFSKKSLIVLGVAFAVTGGGRVNNASAFEVNGYRFNGWAGFSYDYKKTGKDYLNDQNFPGKSNTKQSLAVNPGTRIFIGKDIGGGFSVESQFRTTGFRRGFLKYTDGTNTVTVGKNYYNVSSFADNPSTLSGAIIVGQLGISKYDYDSPTGADAYGLDYIFKDENLYVLASVSSYTTEATLDAIDFVQENENQKFKWFSGNLKSYIAGSLIVNYKVDKFQSSFGFSSKNFNPAAGAYTKNYFSVNFTFADKGDGVPYYVGVGGQYEKSEKKVDYSSLKKGFATILVGNSSGEFTNYSEIKSADDFIYGGGIVRYVEKSNNKIYKGQQFSLVVGYAPVKNVTYNVLFGTTTGDKEIKDNFINVSARYSF